MPTLGLLGLHNGHATCDALRGMRQPAACTSSGIHAGAAAIQGHRSSMEDFIVRAPDLCTCNCETTKTALDAAPASLQLYAVLDGHGGANVARYSAERLRSNLASRLLPDTAAHPAFLDGPTASACSIPAADGATAGPHSQCAGGPDTVETALVESFEAIDRELSAHGTLADESNWSGTTATAVVIGPKQMWVAHVGDSRAILCRQNPKTQALVVLPLTQDHKASCPIEAARVTAAGGAVYRNQGIRLMGVLAVTRALGDRALQPHGLTATPETRRVPLTADDRFLIIASDGLWDVMTNQDAASLAARVFERVEHRPSVSCVAAARIAASVLTRVALQRGSEDNVSVVVIDLRHRAQDILRARYAPPSPRDPSAVTPDVSRWSSGSLETLFRSDGSLRPAAGAAGAVGGPADRAVSTVAVEALAKLVSKRGSKLTTVSSSGCWTAEARVGGESPRSSSPLGGLAGAEGDVVRVVEATDAAAAAAAGRLVSRGSAPLGGMVGGVACGRKRRLVGGGDRGGAMEHMQKALARVEVVQGVESPKREVMVGGGD